MEVYTDKENIPTAHTLVNKPNPFKTKSSFKNGAKLRSKSADKLSNVFGGRRALGDVKNVRYNENAGGGGGSKNNVGEDALKKRHRSGKLVGEKFQIFNGDALKKLQTVTETPLLEQDQSKLLEDLISKDDDPIEYYPSNFEVPYSARDLLEPDHEPVSSWLNPRHFDSVIFDENIQPPMETSFEMEIPIVDASVENMLKDLENSHSELDISLKEDDDPIEYYPSNFEVPYSARDLLEPDHEPVSSWLTPRHIDSLICDENIQPPLETSFEMEIPFLDDSVENMLKDLEYTHRELDIPLTEDVYLLHKKFYEMMRPKDKD